MSKEKIVGATLVDVKAFARFAEVDEYADRHEITRREAVEELVNCGLSHQHDRQGDL